jgi:hypothetical protein
MRNPFQARSFFAKIARSAGFRRLSLLLAEWLGLCDLAEGLAGLDLGRITFAVLAPDLSLFGS